MTHYGCLVLAIGPYGVGSIWCLTLYNLTFHVHGWGLNHSSHVVLESDVCVCIYIYNW
jgi:hypothetical protein